MKNFIRTLKFEWQILLLRYEAFLKQNIDAFEILFIGTAIGMTIGFVIH